MTGSAEEIVTSDSATWMITINTKKKTLSEAYKATQTQIPVVKNYLIENGIEEKIYLLNRQATGHQT